jgi:glucan endo-1,3-alpha-glucosidase
MFKHADDLGGFKLFFSFDHAAGGLSGDPNQYARFFLEYSSRPSYFRFKCPQTGNDKPLVSTFGGETVPDSQWASFKRTVGDVLIVPGFYKLSPSSSLFTNRASLDGIFNWNSWQAESAGKSSVDASSDKSFMNTAHASQRLFMMGISPIQAKALDTANNWYRRGEDNIEVRLAQALDLQPDIIQLQSWNDAGEGHYMGNIWADPLNARTKAVTNGFDHTGYWKILGPFIKSWKSGDRTTANMYPASGKVVQGAFWHHALTVKASCDADTLVDKSPLIEKLAEDAVSGVVLVAQGKTGLVAVVNVGGKELGKMALVPGYNKFKFAGMGTGKVQVEVWDGSRLAAGGYGPLEVKSVGALCNWNFQVVGFEGAA